MVTHVKAACGSPAEARLQWRPSLARPARVARWLAQVARLSPGSIREEEAKEGKRERDEL